MKDKKKKTCKHKFRHTIFFGRNMNEEDKKEYEWVVHECVKCHKKEYGGKLES